MNKAAICFIDSCNRARIPLAIAVVALIANRYIEMSTDDMVITWGLHSDGSIAMFIDWHNINTVQLYQFNCLGQEM